MIALGEWCRPSGFPLYRWMASSTKRRNPFAVRSTSKPYSPVSGFSETVENAAAAPRRMAAARESIAAGAQLVSFDFEGYFRASVLGLPLLVVDIPSRFVSTALCCSLGFRLRRRRRSPELGSDRKWDGEAKPWKSLQNERVPGCLHERSLRPSFPFAQSKPPIVDRAVKGSSSSDGRYSSRSKL